MTFEDERAGTIQSAIDLFGECSIEHKSVTNAWAAVGVGEEFSHCVALKDLARFVCLIYLCNIKWLFIRIILLIGLFRKNGMFQ